MNPLMNFLTPSLELQTYQSDAYNLAMFVSHCGFCLFNIVNVFALVLFEGYATKRLWSNRPSLWSLAGHVVQIMSCITSIHRYNINDEYGYWARVGTWTGIIALSFVAFQYLYLLFFNDTTKVRIGMAVVAALGTSAIVASELDWDEVHFKYLRVFLGGSFACQIPVLLRARHYLKQGVFTVEKGFLSQDTVVRVYEVLALLVFSYFPMAMTGIPVLTYPTTGMVYMICMLNSVCMGRMSFMKNERVNGASSTSAERLPLTR